MLNRNGVYYCARCVLDDLPSHNDDNRLCFGLKTKSVSAAICASKYINQRLEDFWLGLWLANFVWLFLAGFGAYATVFRLVADAVSRT